MLGASSHTYEPLKVWRCKIGMVYFLTAVIFLKILCCLCVHCEIRSDQSLQHKDTSAHWVDLVPYK